VAQRILIDTHIAVWAAKNSPQLPSSARSLLDASPSVLLSSLSIAELELKNLLQNSRVQSDYKSAFEIVGIEVVDFGSSAAHAMRRFSQLSGHDPFDHMILAHAASLSATFLTADRTLLAMGLDWVVDARA
jgi:PIN domain nuclease of toxin-antitoxin system